MNRGHNSTKKITRESRKSEIGGPALLRAPGPVGPVGPVGPGGPGGPDGPDGPRTWEATAFSVILPQSRRFVDHSVTLLVMQWRSLSAADLRIPRRPSELSESNLVFV